MIKLCIAVAALFISIIVHANCNQELMIASAQYVQALEKVILQDSQFYLQGPCKILDEEYKKCPIKMKTFLTKKINFKAVLGYTCAPHTVPPFQLKKTKNKAIAFCF